MRFPSTALLDVELTTSLHFIHLPADIQHEVGEAATRVQTDAQVHVPVFRGHPLHELPQVVRGEPEPHHRHVGEAGLAGALGEDAEAGLVLVHEEEAGAGLGRGQRQAEVAAPAAEVHHEGLCGEAALRQHRPHVVHLLPLAGPSVTAQQ